MRAAAAGSDWGPAAGRGPPAASDRRRPRPERFAAGRLNPSVFTVFFSFVEKNTTEFTPPSLIIIFPSHAQQQPGAMTSHPKRIEATGALVIKTNKISLNVL